MPSVLNSGKGEKRITLDAPTLGEAVSLLAKEMDGDFTRRVFEGDGSVRALINVYINGKNAKFSGGMSYKLEDGDELYILPAVAGGSELTEAEKDRYSRQIMLEQIGYAGQLKLRSARVCVIGVGGLGNPIVSRLTAMGVGFLRIIDRDVIESSNLHRQTLFEEGDIGDIKVEAAAKKLRKLNSGVQIEALPVSVNEYTAPDVIEGCDVVIDALDSVNARYALNRACVEKKIPFVTGAAVGVSGQAFSVVDGSACYCCVFPDLDEDSMPTCSIEGVHPPILSLVGAVQVSEAVKIILGQKPGLSERMLSMDLSGPDFAFVRTQRVAECPVCGSGVRKETAKKPLIIEELCGRNRGKRTFSLTPTARFDLDFDAVEKLARKKGYAVERHSMGILMQNTDCSVSFMKHGSAVLVGPKDEDAATVLYESLLGR